VTFVVVALLGHDTGEVQPGPLQYAVLEMVPVESAGLAVTANVTATDSPAGTLVTVHRTMDPVTDVEQVVGGVNDDGQRLEPLTRVAPDGTVSPMKTVPDVAPVFWAVNV
jgi:hypothetical protein